MSAGSGVNLGAPKTPPRWLDSFMQIIFPERCLFCRAVLPSCEGRPVCCSCGTGFTPAGSICPSCESLIPPGEGPCSCCPALPYLQSLFALSFYEGQWRFLLQNLKYHGRRSLARPLGRWLGLEISERHFCRPDLVVPVPLYRSREKERGFNQSSLIALYTARVLEIQCLPVLFKTIDTASQATLSRTERFENIRSAFSSSTVFPPGTVILLIDDIYSTGSTLKEAAKALHKSGAEVHAAVIAYNPLIK